MPTLSIIVPVYKVEPYLHRCVDSILAQTFTDFELILVDDGSPDNCGAICDEYAAKDSRIIVIHKENGGLSDARNAGLDIAKGEYIGFVDSDDYISPQMYHRMIHLITSHQTDMVVTGYINVMANGTQTTLCPPIAEERILYREDFLNDFFPHNCWILFPCVWNKIYRRTLFHNLRFPVGKIYEDRFLQLPLYDLCHSIAVDNQHHYFYFHLRTDSITNQHYSRRNLALIDAALSQYTFFVDKKLPIQQSYAMDQYITFYCRLFFATYLSQGISRQDFRPYRKQFRSFWRRILANPQTCRMKKLMALTTCINKNLAYKLCKKYFPECVPEYLLNN